MLTFFEFNKLKLREYFGKIDEEQLQSLLELEFEQSKKDTPPISYVFDPEAELQNLRTLPREQKRGALTEFKSKLARQREAWATCRTFLRRKIEVNHDVKKQDLMDWIDTFSDEYGFTDEQTQTAEDIIDDYYENRQSVKEIREQYPDDVDLVNELSGQIISKDTKFRITIGPMSVNIYCDSFTAGRLFTQESVPQEFKYPAFASQSDTGIKYNVITWGTSDFRKYRSDYVVHEDQHQENKLFAQRFDVEQDDSLDLWNRYQNEQDPNIKRVQLECYLRAKRDTALARAKDELIAMKIEKKFPHSYDIWFKQDNSPYDYLSYLRDYKNTDLWKECSQKLLVEEYRRIIESAITAFDQLKKKGGFSIDQTIALLTDKPLTQWPKTARRLLEEDK